MSSAEEVFAKGTSQNLKSEQELKEEELLKIIGMQKSNWILKKPYANALGTKVRNISKGNLV